MADAVIICKKCRRSYPGKIIDRELSFKRLKNNEEMKGTVYWLEKCGDCAKKETKENDN
jgi:hypothetical protein